MKNTIVLSMLLLTGCAASVSSDGKLVQQLHRDTDVSNCEYLGTVVGDNTFGATDKHRRSGAMAEVKNQTAKQGGDSFLIYEEEMVTAFTSHTYIIEADAYICKD